MSILFVMAVLALLGNAIGGDPNMAANAFPTEASPETRLYPIPPTRKCYQCSYSPGKISYVEKTIKERVHDPETGKYMTVYERIMEPQTQPGGWGKCFRAFTKYEAAQFGIDTWDCVDNCMVRIDKSGNLFRGCYRGEYGVDPNNLDTIQTVGSSQYTFCSDELCNRFHLDYINE